MKVAVPVSLGLILSLCYPCISGWAGFSDLDGLDPAQIDWVFTRARDQMELTVTQLEAAAAAESDPARIPFFPGYTANPLINPKETRPLGFWSEERANGGFWAKGSFAGILWILAQETDSPVEAALWRSRAEAWSEPIRHYSGSDSMVNILAPFSRWLAEAIDAQEADAQRDTILAAARRFAEPY